MRKTLSESLKGTISLAKVIESSGLQKIMLDYRQVTFEANAPDIFNIAKFYRQWPVFFSVKACTLINQETLGIASVWEEYCQAQGLNFKCFLNEVDAKNWLLS